jgi:hypothetical protein
MLPRQEVEIAFEALLKELPSEYKELAIESKAFCRARKVKSPKQLMRIVMNYCGIDKVLREVAGSLSKPQQYIKAHVPRFLALYSGKMFGASCALCKEYFLLPMPAGLRDALCLKTHRL